jgi:hypothetical protein
MTNAVMRQGEEEARFRQESGPDWQQCRHSIPEKTSFLLAEGICDCPGQILAVVDIPRPLCSLVGNLLGAVYGPKTLGRQRVVEAHPRCSNPKEVNMSDPKVQLLLDRAEMSGVLHRYAKAIDTKDWKLLATCFTEDLEADFRSFAGREIGRGRDNWVESIQSTIEGMQATQHLTANHTHEIDGDAGKLTAYVQAAHWLPNKRGDAEYTVGGYYDCDMVKTGGEWRIRKYKLTVTWHRGNREILRLAPKRR